MSEALELYSMIGYISNRPITKQANPYLNLDPRIVGALLGGAGGLGLAALSSRKDEEGNSDKPWLRNLLIGAGLGGLAGQGYQMLQLPPQTETPRQKTPIEKEMDKPVDKTPAPMPEKDKPKNIEDAVDVKSFPYDKTTASDYNASGWESYDPKKPVEVPTARRGATINSW